MKRGFVAVLLAVLASGVLSQTDILDVQAVPETAEAASRQLFSSDKIGGYYGSPPGGGRNLIKVGGYGYGGHNLVQRGGYGYGRSLVEEDEDGLVLEPRDLLLEYFEQQQAQLDSQQMAAQQAAGGVSAAAVAALRQAHSSSSTSSSSRRGSSHLQAIPAGQCYCRYDSDFNTWALGQNECKEALYTRCQAEPNLSCAWLDMFYTPAPGPGHLLPHEADIKAFMYSDCSPQPPCACAGVSFDGTDSVPSAVACCRDLRVACKTPFNGVTCDEVEAFCSDDTPNPNLAAWSKHMLLHADCSSYTGMPYHYAALQDMQAAAVAAAATASALPPATAEALLLGEVMRSMEQQLPAAPAGSQKDADSSRSSRAGSHQRSLVIVLAAIAAGAVSVAVVAVMFAVRREEEAPMPSPLCAPELSAIDVYQSLLKEKALKAPQPAACVGAGLSAGPPLWASLHRERSSDSCLSRIISISEVSQHGSGVRQPLLPQQWLDRLPSCSSTTSSSDSMSADSIP